MRGCHAALTSELDELCRAWPLNAIAAQPGICKTVFQSQRLRRALGLEELAGKRELGAAAHLWGRNASREGKTDDARRRPK